MKGRTVNQPVRLLRLHNNPAQSLCFAASVRESSDSFKLAAMEAAKSVSNPSANALLVQLELHVLPGNFRSLNIVSGQIHVEEHAASPSGMLGAELAGKH